MGRKAARLASRRNGGRRLVTLAEPVIIVNQQAEMMRARNVVIKASQAPKSISDGEMYARAIIADEGAKCRGAISKCDDLSA